jgi:hypothetical protein
LWLSRLRIPGTQMTHSGCTGCDWWMRLHSNLDLQASFGP